MFPLLTENIGNKKTSLEYNWYKTLQVRTTIYRLEKYNYLELAWSYVLYE